MRQLVVREFLNSKIEEAKSIIEKAKTTEEQLLKFLKLKNFELKLDSLRDLRRHLEQKLSIITKLNQETVIVRDTAEECQKLFSQFKREEAMIRTEMARQMRLSSASVTEPTIVSPPPFKENRRNESLKHHEEKAEARD